MPNFYWVGSTGTTGITRYDFNTPSNWVTAFWNSQGTGQSAGWQFRSATSAPGNGDGVWIGMTNLGIDSLLPSARSPLLFGGYSGNVAYGEWAGSINATGTTYASSLNTFNATMLPSSSPVSKYPYNFLGGGITGAVYSWVLTQGATDSDFTGGTGQRATRPFRIKVRDAYNIFNSNAACVCEIVNEKSVVPLVGIASAPFCKTTVTVSNLGQIRFSGASINKLTNNGGSSSNIHLSGLTCGQLITDPSSVYVERDAVFSTVEVVTAPYRNPIWFNGSLDTRTVETDLGLTASVTGANSNINDSTITVRPIFEWWNGGGLTTQPSFYFGVIGLTAFTASCRRIQFESTPGATGGGGTGQMQNAKWNLQFIGGASAANIEANDTIVKAYAYIDPSATVSVGTLGMARGSVLDLTNAAEFNNWFFGSITGEQINGGIVFRDDTPIIRGSEGVRLFNTQLIFRGRAEQRAGKPTATLVGQESLG